MNIHLEHQQPADRSRSYGRNILIALVAAATIFGLELWAGFKTGSLALLADAGHVFVDMSGLLLAYVALIFASRPASPRATYGYGRAEVLAAAVNGSLVVAIAVNIVIAAVKRLNNPIDSLDTNLILIVAGIGLGANLIAATFLHADSKENINSRGAFLNVMGDSLASVGVIAGALIVRFTGNTVWDTVVSFAVAAIILVAAWNMLRGAVAILLEWAPPHLQPELIKAAVESLSVVRNVHDLHVWTLTPGQHPLSMHVSITEEASAHWVQTIESIEELLMERFGLNHCTIQVEPEGHDQISDSYDPVHGELRPATTTR
jgi:cobalt-zinc-cadmium efflux system protein